MRMENVEEDCEMAKTDKKRPHLHKPVLKKMQNANAHFATDPNGSYTGKCADPNEIPVQDADDL